jgi:hypothetical protein
MKNLVGDQGFGHNFTGGASSSTAGSPSSSNAKPAANQPQNSGHIGNSYVNFMRGSSEMLRQIVIDEVWVNNLFEQWYGGQMAMINDWLTERLQQSLSPYQLTCLSFIVKKVHSDFELQGIDEELVNSKNYESINRRLKLEETNCALNENNASTNSSTSFTGANSFSLSNLGNAQAAVNNVSSVMEGAGAKVFALFK